MTVEQDRKEAVRLFRAMDRDALIAETLEWEANTGYDSIPTIERYYDEKCVWPGCKFRRKDPVEMWLHVHLSEKHLIKDEVLVANLCYRAYRAHGLEMP